jgi:hypothetical protein
MNYRAFKSTILDTCLARTNERIAQAKKAIAAAQEAANTEEKSSMGDKYETGRAMSHNQRDMSARQLAEASADMAILSKIDIHEDFSVVGRGAGIIAGDLWFFLATGLGLITVEEKNVFVVSLKAPLATTLLGKQAGDTFTFKNKLFTIDLVF